MLYIWLKLIHVVSSTFLFGTGLGSAFYMYRANKTNNLHAMYFAAKNCVLADWLFTTPSVIIQPITGFWMIFIVHFSLTSAWILWALILYVIAGACWLPVVYIQMKMRDMLKSALARKFYTTATAQGYKISGPENRSQLPQKYYRYFKIWFWLGWPAFIGVLIIFYLMFFKP